MRSHPPFAFPTAAFALAASTILAITAAPYVAAIIMVLR
jgi:hypothetical protein